MINSLHGPDYIIVAVHHSKMHEIPVDHLYLARLRQKGGGGKKVFIPVVEPYNGRTTDTLVLRFSTGDEPEVPEDGVGKSGAKGKGKGKGKGRPDRGESVIGKTCWFRHGEDAVLTGEHLVGPSNPVEEAQCRAETSPGLSWLLSQS